MIDVILRDDVPSLGKAGQMVRVKPGYARNFLLPRGLAFEATEGNRKRIEAEGKARAARADSDRAEAQELADRIGRVTLNFAAKAGDDGRLFGSITSADIAHRLAEEGVVVDKRKIELEHPLKQLGFHSVPVRLHHAVQAEVKVNVAIAD